jgi:hypothetical protein
MPVREDDDELGYYGPGAANPWTVTKPAFDAILSPREQHGITNAALSMKAGHLALAERHRRDAGYGGLFPEAVPSA